MRIIFFAIAQMVLFFSVFAQKTITFQSYDGLPITADFYESKKGDPYLLLFHQARFSRGEYKETAERFVKLGYNCLAVDLRSGGEVNYITNQTSVEAKKRALSTNYIDAKPDIQAAIEFAFSKSKQEVVILGSSYSASLSLIVARENPHVAAVIVFSPGEYFENQNLVQESISGLKKPIFAASTANEYANMKALFKDVPVASLNLFKPSKGKGVHGSSALWKSNPGSEEYWLSLLLFFNQIKD